VDPTSPLWVILFLLAAGGLLYLVVWVRHIAFKSLAGAGVVAVGILTGMLMVNDYYGYYTSWGTLYDDVTNASPNIASASHYVSHPPKAGTGKGVVEEMSMPGAASGINRTGVVYLPPQYSDPKYANVKFPVVELLHGTPGNAEDEINALNANTVMDALIDQHIIGPMVIVMPTQFTGTSFEECLDTSKFKDETYLVQDVPNDIRAKLRVSSDPTEWAIAGQSSGGYCAMNIGLRDKSDYGAAAALDGYFRAQDGPAGDILGNNATSMAENSPLTLAGKLPDGTAPLPAFWVLAGTGNSGDDSAASAFVAAMKHVESVTQVTVSGGKHNYYTWRAAMPTMLTWIWNQIAPPSLRVLFPSVGNAGSATLPLDKPQGSRKGIAQPSKSGTTPTTPASSSGTH
jgi:S-formylglutathione hydrolase FrmB